MLLAHCHRLAIRKHHRSCIRQLSRIHTSSSRYSMAAAPGATPSAQELRGQSCSLLGCSSDTPSLPPEQLPQLMAALPAWQLSADQTSIRKSFVAKNFVAAINFFNAVRDVAEAEGHHPDLHLTSYRNVEVVLSTHAIKALSMFDMIMAAKIDALPVQYSPKWEREHKAQLGQGGAAAAGAAGAGAGAGATGAGTGAGEGTAAAHAQAGTPAVAGSS